MKEYQSLSQTLLHAKPGNARLDAFSQESSLCRRATDGDSENHAPQIQLSSLLLSSSEKS